MSLFNVFGISGSALQAQTLRLNTISSNMANANSVSSSTDTTYRARHPVFAPMVKDFENEKKAVGVRVLGVVESNKPLRSEYSHGHPLADEDGYIYMPNVNMVEEMADMISASRSYQTNVEIMTTAKKMLMQTLQMGQ